MIGLGISTLAAEKVEKELKKFLKENDIDRKEAHEVAQVFVKDVKKQQQKAIRLINKELKEAEKKLEKQVSAKKKTKAKKAIKKASKAVSRVKKNLRARLK